MTCVTHCDAKRALFQNFFCRALNGDFLKSGLNASQCVTEVRNEVNGEMLELRVRDYRA